MGDRAIIDGHRTIVDHWTGPLLGTGACVRGATLRTNRARLSCAARRIPQREHSLDILVAYVADRPVGHDVMNISCGAVTAAERITIRPVEQPRRNIELKAHDLDPVASVRVCRELGAEDCGELWQRDTYFEVHSGGLKLREQTPGRPHLIQFNRADEPQQRESRYRIIEVDDATVTRTALTEALGIQIVVTKRRRLFLWRDVRIHLDEVEQLGRFIELEAVASPTSDLTREHELVSQLREALGITHERLVPLGYATQLHGFALTGS